MENIPPETAEAKVPSKGFAVASLVCGISSLAKGGVTVFRPYIFHNWEILVWGAIYTIAGTAVTIVLPLLAVIFGAIPLKQGGGTDWDGKGMAKAGLVMGIVSLTWLICWVSFFDVLNGSIGILW